jgi:plastocyanin
MKSQLCLTALACLLLSVQAAVGETIQIKISDLVFSPTEVTAKLGDTVEWSNGDFVDHTATDKGGTWDVAIPAGKSVQLKFTSPGTFAYYCKVHPGMTGTIHVDAK